MKHKIHSFLVMLMCLVSVPMGAGTTVRICPTDKGDLTLLLRNEIGKACSDEIRIVFEKGRYEFRPDYSVQKYCAVTNHGNGLKNILVNIMDKKSVVIEGNGAELVMHGRFFPFLLENCSNVRISDLTLDWDIPFLFQAEVTAVSEKEGWREVRPYCEGYSWKLRSGHLSFPDIDGFSYSALGNTLAFDPAVKDVQPGAKDIYSSASRVIQRPDGILRIYEKCRYYPPVGAVQVSKGNREDDRYAPAFGFKECRDILLENVTVHHALGMGFLFERCENICLTGAEISPTPGTDRLVSTTADATHFVNCKGQILLEDCSFRNMLDDGSNVHGTYLTVDQVIGPNTLVAELMHFEQQGFKFAAPGDEIWFIHQPSPERGETNVVRSVKVLNEKYSVYTFEKPFPVGLKPGDLLENRTWNPDYTMRRCRISHHRARNLVLKTPGKIIIEDNDFSSMMSSILFRGESFFWYESGAVCDALIMNNRFRDCAAASPDNAVLLISPRLGRRFDPAAPFDRNIRFLSNEIDGPNPKIVDASRTESLVIRDNRITITSGKPSGPVENFRTTDCTTVVVLDNEINYK